jgi:hypothetical protein
MDCSARRLPPIPGIGGLAGAPQFDLTAAISLGRGNGVE